MKFRGVPSPGHETRTTSFTATIVALLMFWWCAFPAWEVTAQAQAPSASSGDDLQVEVKKKGLGKEVLIHKGPKEWYMLVEVAEGNTVVIRQEKEGDTYLVDESETHDRALSKPEIDDVVEDFINSVKTRTQTKK